MGEWKAEIDGVSGGGGGEETGAKKKEKKRKNGKREGGFWIGKVKGRTEEEG